VGLFINNAKVLQFKENYFNIVQRIHKKKLRKTNLRKNVIVNFFDNCNCSTSGVINMFPINVIFETKNIFEVWNKPQSIHPILSYLFSTIIRDVFKQKFKSKYASE